MVDVIASAVCIITGIGSFIERHEGAITALATGAIGLFTYYLWKSTKGLTDLASQQEKMTRTIERAYVKISHRPPGLNFEPVMRYWVQMRIQNFGRTPARITASVVDRI